MSSTTTQRPRWGATAASSVAPTAAAPSSSSLSSSAQQTAVNDVVLLREHCISVGRPLTTVVAPITNSILDTIFWGDGYKSLAHVVFISFGWWKGFVGLRFMSMLLYFHVVVAVIMNSKKSPSRTDSEERRAALYAYRASTAYLAQLIERYPYAFFVLPQGVREKSKLHLTVAIVTAVLTMMWFPSEARTVLNAVFGFIFRVEGLFPVISVYDVLDLWAAPITVLVIIVGGLGKVGPRDPRYLSPTTSNSQQKSFPNASSSSTAHGSTSSSGSYGSGASAQPSAAEFLKQQQTQLQEFYKQQQQLQLMQQQLKEQQTGVVGGGGSATPQLSRSFANRSPSGAAHNSTEEATSPSGAVASQIIKAAGGANDPALTSTGSIDDIAALNLNHDTKVVDDESQLKDDESQGFLTPQRMDQLIGDGFSYNNSQTRYEILMPLLRAVSNDLTAIPYWMQPTPDGEWDFKVARMPTLPVHAHKILALVTAGPQWSAWKRVHNKPERKPLPGNGDGRNPIADGENVDDDIVVMNHPTSFSQVKCGYNRTRIRGVKFEDVLSWLCDDMFKENGEPIKSTKDLNVFRFDVFLSEYRRLAHHTYTIDTPEGPISTVAKVVHYVYKQMVMGVAPRDCPMFTTARELTEAEMRHYGLFDTHANTFFPRRVVKNGGPQPLGRVFLISSSPAENVPQAAGHVTATIHRHAILVIAPPKKSDCGDMDDDEHEIVDIITMMCGEPGGKIPSFAADIGRGEQLKVINAISTHLLSDMRAAGQCTTTK